MKRWMFVLLVCACLGQSKAAAPIQVNDPVEGRKLARELREVFPAEEMAVNAVLRISKPRSETREVSIVSSVTISNGSWASIYRAELPDGRKQTLTVRHTTNGPNAYTWQRGEIVEKPAPANATNSFAFSDFALMDLGLEFFHWPTQVLVTREMRKGRGCDVIESRPAQPTLYSRVVSWIDQESRAQGQPGVIMAEAYDRNGKLMKEFEIRGMKEVAGRWHVREMELRNRQTKTSTRLQFLFNEK